MAKDKDKKSPDFKEVKKEDLPKSVPAAPAIKSDLEKDLEKRKRLDK